MNPPTLLIIEDDDLQYEIYEEALAKYTLIRVASGSEALTQIPQQPPDILILDHVLAHGELVLEFLPQFKELLPFVPIIIVSGALEVHQQMDALQGPRRAHFFPFWSSVGRRARIGSSLRKRPSSSASAAAV